MFKVNRNMIRMNLLDIYIKHNRLIYSLPVIFFFTEFVTSQIKRFYKINIHKYNIQVYKTIKCSIS